MKSLFRFLYANRDAFFPFYLKIWLPFLALSWALAYFNPGLPGFHYAFLFVAAIGVPLYVVVGLFVGTVVGFFYGVIWLLGVTYPFSLYVAPFAILAGLLWKFHRSRQDAAVTHPSQIQNPGHLLAYRR